jgi:hypothetical protein
MNGSINATPTGQSTIGGINNCVNLKRRDVSSDNFNPLHKSLPGKKNVFLNTKNNRKI